LIRQKIDDADRFPLSPHKRRKSGHFPNRRFVPKGDITPKHGQGLSFALAI
jgi:hypothetical protein